MSGQARDQGKISPQDYADLAAAITSLKTILTRINDKELVAGWVSQRAAVFDQQIRAKVAAIHK
jgi:hypothetical protein